LIFFVVVWNLYTNQTQYNEGCSKLLIMQK
jgi:hypothetical protein